MEDIEAIKARMLKKLLEEKTQKEQPSLPDKPIVLTDYTFDSEISKYPAVVVDCWAEWCYPCRIISPLVDELAREYKGRIVFARLNVDENPATSQKYEIMAIPTLLIFKNGNYVSRIIGAKPKQAMEAEIKMAIA
ncbi:MAG: thioredoxin [Conexivisphaerales archaeon]